MKINTDSQETIKDSLFELARYLILNKVLIINDARYSFIDIEIYYWHKLHQDDYAKGVKHTRPIGEFELHRYGLDLSLGNNAQVEFGGILIRGLYDLKNNYVIQKADIVRTVFNNIKMGNNSIELLDFRTPWVETFQTKRINLGIVDNPQKANYFNADYRFLAKDKQLFTNYKEKEKIFADSNLSELEITSLLGYKIKR